MGINDYIKDIFDTYINNSLSGKLANSNLFYNQYRIKGTNYSISLAREHYSDKKLVIYLAYHDGHKWRTNDELFAIYENEILLQESDSEEPVQHKITSQCDLFNLQLNFDIYLSYDNLKFIQNSFLNMTNKTDFKHFILYYGKNEEKMYGYN